MNYTPQTGQRQANLRTKAIGAVLTLLIGLAPVSLPAADKLFLKNGETLEASVLEFAEGKLTVKLPSGEKHEGLLSEIEKIEFELGTGETDDQIQLKNGGTINCAMVSYENGQLSIRLPNGQKQTGNIQEIQSMKVTPAEAKASFADLVEQKLEEGQPSAPAPSGVAESPPQPSTSASSHRGRIKINGRAEKQPRLKFDVDRAKSESRDHTGYYTYKSDIVTMQVNIENEDFSRKLESGQGWIFAFLRNIENRREYKVLSKETFEFPTLEPGEVFHWEGQPYRGGTYRDRGYSPWGFEYHGWLCILLNGDNQIVAVASSNEGWAKNAEEAADLQADDLFDYQFDVIPY